jgi:dihydrofolate reductase
MARPQCSVYIAMSLDGFIARADGSIDWLLPMQQSGDDYGHTRFMDSIDAIVCGRKTHETALGFPAWPYRGKPCVVLSHREFVPHHGEERYEGPLDALIDRLGEDGVRRIYVDGAQVIHQFLAAGLVDDLTVSVVPLLLGEGLSLFGGGSECWLRLVESRAFASGLVQLEYRIDAAGG